MLDRLPRLLTRLDVERDAVPARLLDHLEVVLGVADLQVAVDHAFELVDERRDRLEDDRANGDGLDEMAVADVEVEEPGTRPDQVVDLIAEPEEVARV